MEGVQVERPVSFAAPFLAQRIHSMLAGSLPLIYCCDCLLSENRASSHLCFIDIRLINLEKASM